MACLLHNHFHTEARRQATSALFKSLLETENSWNPRTTESTVHISTRSSGDSHECWSLKCSLPYHVTYGSVLYTIYWIRKGQKPCILWLAWLASCLRDSCHELCTAEKMLIVECRLAKTDFSLLRSAIGTYACCLCHGEKERSWVATVKITGEGNRHWLVVRLQRGSHRIREVSVSPWGLPGWLLRLPSCPSHFLWCIQQTSLIEAGLETAHLYFL